MQRGGVVYLGETRDSQLASFAILARHSAEVKLWCTRIDDFVHSTSIRDMQKRAVVPATHPSRHSPTLTITLLTLTVLAAAGLIVASVPRGIAGNAELQPAGGDVLTFSPAEGSYDSTIRVRLVPPHAGAEQVLFTTDGSIPTLKSGAIYDRPIPLVPTAPGVTVIRARALHRDGELGPVTTAAYAVGLEASLPIVSLVAAPYDLWDGVNGIYENPLGRGQGAERPAHLTFIDVDGKPGFSTGVGIRIHGYQSRVYAKKSLRVYFRSEYGLPRLRYPLYPDHDLTSFDTLVLHSGGQDYAHPPLTNWTLIRNQLAAALALDLGVPATHSRAALLFINGEPWGIVQIRERIDEDFLRDTYKLSEVDLLEAPESALREVTIGDRAAWDSLMQDIETGDLSDPGDYAEIAGQVDLDNFIAYHILQIYSANTDWPAHNIHLFRSRVPGGQWRWLVWDSDNGFDAEGYSQVHSDMISHLLDYRHPETGGRDTLLFRKLLDNPEYRLQFLSTLADLLNTKLAPAAVIGHIDALAGEIATDIEYETARWPGYKDWSANIQQLRDFATGRPDYVRQHTVSRLELPGTMELNVQPPAGGKGKLAVNGIVLEAAPWQGIYFQSVPVTVIAVPAPGYVFDGWAEPQIAQQAEVVLTTGDRWTLTPRFRRAASSIPQPGDLTIVNVQADHNTSSTPTIIDLRVNRGRELDIRGWRITDNDSKTATDEGSLIFGSHPEFEHVPYGTIIRIVVGKPSNGTANSASHPTADDTDPTDRRFTLYVGNGHLDAHTDPWFSLGRHDNLVVLAPGKAPGFQDDVGIDFWGPDTPITPGDFGILVDGVAADRQD